VHDPGKIISDLAMTIALGGDCLADAAVLRAQPELAGPIASDPMISRLITALAAEEPRALKAIRKARAAARERAWALAGTAAPGADGSLIPVDIDATIVIAHSEVESCLHLEEDLCSPSSRACNYAETRPARFRSTKARTSSTFVQPEGLRFARSVVQTIRQCDQLRH
jgi:Transposase DDE domain group 1